MPRKKAGEAAKRFPLNMRTTREMRGRLERAAATSGRSLIQEVEARLLETFKDDEIENDLQVMYRLIREYLWRLSLHQRVTREKIDFHEPATADALRLGFELIVAAACEGAISEEKTKKFFLDDLPRQVAANLANEAFNTLSLAGLVPFAHELPFKLSEWMRAKATK